MSPTCSSRFLVGRNARSATARTTASILPRADGAPPALSQPGSLRHRCATCQGGTALRLGPKGPWYVAPALRERLAAAGLLVAGAIALSACGGGERQDANEPKGQFKVQVVRASFPEKQKLAKRSLLRIAVKNVDTREIPDIAVTLNGLDRRKPDPELADPSR